MISPLLRLRESPGGRWSRSGSRPRSPPATRRTACRDRLRNEHGFDGIAAADVEQPFDGAVRRNLLRQNRRAAHLAHARQLLAQAACQVGHVLEAGHAFLVDPAIELDGPKRFSPSRSRRRPSPRGRSRADWPSCSINVRRRSGPGEVGDLDGSGFGRQAVHGVGVDRPAKSARMVPLSAFFGSVAPISSRFFRMAFSPSRTWTKTGPRS